MKSRFAEFDYFYIGSLDMNGGDMAEYQRTKTFNDAFDLVKAGMNFDTTKIGIIHDCGKGQLRPLLKKSEGTNPSASKSHHVCTSIFYGRTV